MWNEFKKFAIQGNALDLAVGVIIGAAFGRIVTSLVDDVLMPPLGLITREGRFLESVPQPHRPALRFAGRGQGGRSADDQLRGVPEQRHQLRDRRLRDLHPGAADQSPQGSAAGGAREAGRAGRALRRGEGAHPDPRSAALTLLTPGAGRCRRLPTDRPRASDGSRPTRSGRARRRTGRLRPAAAHAPTARRPARSPREW